MYNSVVTAFYILIISYRTHAKSRQIAQKRTERQQGARLGFVWACVPCGAFKWGVGAFARSWAFLVGVGCGDAPSRRSDRGRRDRERWASWRDQGRAREGAHILNAGKGQDVEQVREGGRESDGGEDARPLYYRRGENGLVTSPFPFKKIV